MKEISFHEISISFQIYHIHKGVFPLNHSSLCSTTRNAMKLSISILDLSLTSSPENNLISSENRMMMNRLLFY